jgi:hypothetical protein
MPPLARQSGEESRSFADKNYVKSRVRGEAASRQPRNSKQALAMRQKLIEFPAQIPLFLERIGWSLVIAPQNAAR